MDVRQLSYFIAAAECGTFSAAAKQNYISQPALSKSIRTLEEELGVKLFARHDRRTELTPIGRDVYIYAKALVAEYNNILNIVAVSKRNFTNQLRVGVTFGAGGTLIYQLVSEYMEQHNTEVCINGAFENEIEEQLLSQKIDIGVSLFLSAPSSDQFESVVAGTISFCLLVSEDHPLASRTEGVHLAELENETFIMPTDEFILSSIIREHCEKVGFTPNSKMALNRYDIIFDMVRQNHGVAIVASELWNVTFSGHLVCIPLLDGIKDCDITLVTLKDAPKKSPAKQFLDFVREKVFANN